MAIARKWIILALVAVITMFGILFIRYPTVVKEILSNFVHSIESHKRVGSIVYAITFGILSILLVPTTIPTLIAGFIFKPWPIAVIVSMAGSQIGIILAFVLGRSLFRPYVQQKVLNDVRFLAIDTAIQQYGAKVVVLLRLSPIFSFGICNYIFSIFNSITYCFAGFIGW